MSDFLEQLITPPPMPSEKPAKATVSLKDLSKAESGGSGASAVYHIDPRKLSIEEGFNPRDISAREAYIDWMAKSIAENGVQKPIEVRTEGDKILIVDGECRWRGALRALAVHGADLKTVPVTQEPKGTTPAMRLARVVSIYNNSNPLTPLEQAQAVARVIRLGWTHDNVAKQFAISRERVYQLLDLEAAPEDVKSIIKEGLVSPTLAVEVLKQQGEAAGAKALTDAAAAQKAKTKPGKKAKKLKPSQVKAEAPRKDANANDKDRMKAYDKGKQEALAIIVTLWSSGKIDDDSGSTVSVRFTRDKYDRIKRHLGV